MNKNSKRRAKQLTQEITQAHREHLKVTPALSKRRSKWKGVSTVKRTAAIQAPTAATSDGKFR
jgi:hypothetical protein